MDINNILNKAIKVLLVTLLCVMLIIGLLFVTPVYVHATNSPRLLNVTSNSYDDVRTALNLVGRNNYQNNDYYISANGQSAYVGCIVSNGSQVVVGSCTQGITAYRASDSSSTVTSFAISSRYNSHSSYYVNIPLGSSGTSWTTTDYVPTFSSLDEFLTAVETATNTPTGDFVTLPQVDSATEIDYSTVAASGANIYAGNPTSVYSFLGQYQTELSPTSQYCYVQTGEDAYIAVCFSSVPLTVYRAFINGQTLSSTVCTEYDTNKYYAIFNQFSTLEDISPITPFASLSDAQEAFSGASSGGGAGSAAGVVTAGAFSYNVPAGNVLYVKVRAGSLASVTVDMLNLSGTESPYWTETQINTMWASGISSLPTENTTFPLSGMNRIVFTPDASKGLDGYGRSNFGIAQHAPLNGGWFVVYNPAYAGSQWMYGGTAGRTDLLNINPTVTVNCQYAIEYYLYPLSESLTVDGGTSSSNDDYSNPWSGQVDPSGTMQRTDDKDTEPEVGGQQSNVVTQNNMTLSDYLRNIETVISDFANNFVTLLTAPISHISRLITAGSTFMSSISQFFNWLPEPVYAVITSALVVAVVIGVIKLLF